MPRKVALAAVAFAALVMLAAACGGVEREPNLAEASERTAATGSFRLELHVVATELAAHLRTSCQGAFDGARKRVHLACAGPDGHRLFESIHVGPDEYTRMRDEDRWTKSSPQDFDQATEWFSPERILAILQGASRETERIGEESVRGVATVRYRMQVDCEEAELGCPDGELGPVDVWIDDDGLVRRVELDQEQVEFDVEFFDFGAELDIQPPPADQVEVDDAAPDQCGPGEGRPIRAQQAIAALRDHGFDVERGGFGCLPSTAASLSTNLDDEEFLSCFVLEEPSDESSAVLVIGAPRGGIDPVERELENLRCTLFLEREDDQAVERLDAAFAELKRAVRP